MDSNDPTVPDDPDKNDPLTRLSTLEAALAGTRDRMSTRRLVLVDEFGQERLVADLVDGVMELRLDLPGQPAGRRTGLLLFTTPEQEDWSAGVGVQIWVQGNAVKELVWWADEPDPCEP